MTKAEKTALIEALTDKLSNSKFFYITDYSSMTVEQLNSFRRKCFQEGIEYKAVKNSFIKEALGRVDETAYKGLYDTLKGASAIMFSEEGKTPGVVLKEYRKGNEKPILKAAYIDSSIYLGDESIDALAKLKSKSDLIGEIIGLLQSPMTNLMSQLNSGGNTIHGLLKAMGEKGEA
jgi:large subunit ribosomal protein L10